MSYADLTPQTRWQRLPDSLFPGHAHPDVVLLGVYVQPVKDRLRAIVTVDLMDPYDASAGHWLHLSISRDRRLPTWGDLVTARDALGFADRLFVQLVPPRSHWLNVHSYCLHLMHRLDAPTVPRVIWDQVGATGERYEHGEAPE